MRRRYPATLWMLMLIAFGGSVIGISALWHPAAYIFLAAWLAFLLIVAVRQDRKRAP